MALVTTHSIYVNGLTIHMDINRNPGPCNCLGCLYLNARSLKAFVPSSVDPSVKVCKISKLQGLVDAGVYDLVCICETWLNDKQRTTSRLFYLSTRPR